MRLLVTGAAGFIGTNFVRQALEAGGPAARRVERLVAVDLLTYAGNFANLADLAAERRFRFERLDIAQRNAMEALLREERLDAIVNFAAESHVDRSIADQAPFLHTNVHGTLALLDAARTVGGVRRFLQVSTDEVYGSIAQGRATEEWAARPSSPYAASKTAADAFVLAYATTFDVPAVITRCSNNYGPDNVPTAHIPGLAAPLLVAHPRDGPPLLLYGAGPHVRDGIRVSDLCAALWHVPDLPAAEGNIFNVSAENECPNRAVTELILRLTGRPPDLVRYVTDRPGHDRRYALDAARLRATGWRPRPAF